MSVWAGLGLYFAGVASVFVFYAAADYLTKARESLYRWRREPSDGHAACAHPVMAYMAFLEDDGSITGSGTWQDLHAHAHWSPRFIPRPLLLLVEPLRRRACLARPEHAPPGSRQRHDPPPPGLAASLEREARIRARRLARATGTEPHYPASPDPTAVRLTAQTREPTR